MTSSAEERQSRVAAAMQARERLARLARLLDSAVSVPGTGVRFGLDAAIGLLPGVGDLVATGLSLYLIAEARRLGISKWALLRMLGNVGIDLLLGSVPVAGDVFDVFWRANRRNMAILDRHLADIIRR